MIVYSSIKYSILKKIGTVVKKITIKTNGSDIPF